MLKTEDSEDEDSASRSGPNSLTEGSKKGAEGADAATRKLLRRKEQLETRKATLERQRERMQVNKKNKFDFFTFRSYFSSLIVCQCNCTRAMSIEAGAQ